MLVYWEAFNLKLRINNVTRVTFLVKFKRKQRRISNREPPECKCPALLLCWPTRWEVMEMSTYSSNTWLVWTQQLSVLTKLTRTLVCISSHQARKLLLIPYPPLSVHVYGISCSFIGHFPWWSHELFSPEQASQSWREILIPGCSCSRRNIFHIFSFFHESNSVQVCRLCHSFFRK
jgi:hypothetical protein